MITILIAVKQEVKQLGNETLSCKTSLMRKQINAGSLANLVSSSEFEVSETREVSLKIESDHIKKEETLKDDRVRLVNAKGDIPICKYWCPYYFRKNITVQVIGLSRNSVIQYCVVKGIEIFIYSTLPLVLVVLSLILHD